MIFLPLSLNAWNSASFNDVFKQEVCSLDSSLLPLQQGLQYSSYVITDKLSLTVLSVKEGPGLITIKAGLFYNGIIAGCSCADDPTPTDETNEYCEVLFSIDKQSAETSVTIID